MTPLDVLTNARTLILEKGFCQHVLAQNAAGDECSPFIRPRPPDHEEAIPNPLAVAYDLLGATQVFANFFASENQQALRFLRRCCGDGQHSIVEWEDAKGRTKDEIIAALDAAITLAAQEEPL